MPTPYSRVDVFGCDVGMNEEHSIGTWVSDVDYIGSELDRPWRILGVAQDIQGLDLIGDQVHIIFLLSVYLRHK